MLSGPIDPTPALAAVGLVASDLTDQPARIASTGLAYAVLPVKPSALDRCQPDLATLRTTFAYPHEATGAYVVAWDALRSRAQARMFAGDVGVAEDPATGSAALALGVYLGGTGQLSDGLSNFTVDQGVAMGRPSVLTVSCDVSEDRVTEARVSGEVVHIAEGRIAVP